MASPALFANVPPFPKDVIVAPLQIVSLSQSRETDLRGDKLGEVLMSQIDELSAAGKETFVLPDDIKIKYLHDAPRSLLGFKPIGNFPTEDSRPDRNEMFNISRDAVLGITSSQSLPKPMESRLPTFQSFFQNGQEIIDTILSILATELGLPPHTFTQFQRPDQPSGTISRVIRTPPSRNDEDLRTALIHHTDFGTITLLANIVGGLQILTPGCKPSDSNGWTWIQPRPGHLIVNLGDAMVQWSGGRLRSNVHRIMHAPGAQRFVDRYSLALLARPEKTASMKPLLDPVGMEDWKETSDHDRELTAYDWEVAKSMAMKRGEYEIKSIGGFVSNGKL